MLEVRCGICQAADMNIEEGRNWVIEGPGGHMRNFDIYGMGKPQ